MVDETEFDVMDADHDSRLNDKVLKDVDCEGVGDNDRFFELNIDNKIAGDICNCKQEYSIEVHGENMALYFGRCNHRHGMNLCTISEIASNCHLDVIEGLLNRGITR